MARCTMPRWLLNGEQVEFSFRSHRRIIIWPITVALVLVFAGSLALGGLQPRRFEQWAPGGDVWREPAIVAVVLSVTILLLAYPVRRILSWCGTRYVLTNHRILVRRGLFNRIKESYLLDHVQEVRAVANWRQKMVGSGDVQLHLLGGRVRVIADVPELSRFNGETQEAWRKAVQASVAQTTR